MPFKSKAQQRACYAKKSRGQNGSWNCDEWSKSTNFKKLPEKASAAYFGALLGQLAVEKAGCSDSPAEGMKSKKPVKTKLQNQVVS